MRLAMLVLSAAVAAWPQCGAPRLEATPDFAWLVGGQPAESGKVPQLFFLHADDSTRTSAGTAPLIEERVTFASGRWGSALAVADGGRLAYARQGHLDPNEGAIEM